MKKEKETLWEVIQSLPNDPDYKEIENAPIPLGKSVIIKKAKQHIVHQGGIIIPEASAENSQMPKVGIIYAVGPDCTKGVRTGLRCYYNHWADLEIQIGAERYVLADEGAVYYILRSTAQKIDYGKGVKSADQVRREKKTDQWADFAKKKTIIDQNEKDKKHDKTKGKVKVVYSVKK